MQNIEKHTFSHKNSFVKAHHYEEQHSPFVPVWATGPYSLALALWALGAEDVEQKRRTKHVKTLNLAADGTWVEEEESISCSDEEQPKRER